MWKCVGMQVRKLSVKPVNSPLLYDATGRPADNGLYDQGMGPMEPGDVYALSTCPVSLVLLSSHLLHHDCGLPASLPWLWPLYTWSTRILQPTH